MHRNLAALSAGFMAFGVLMLVVAAAQMTDLHMTLPTAFAFAMGGFGVGLAINSWLARRSQRAFDQIAVRMREREDRDEASLRIVRPNEGAAA